MNQSVATLSLLLERAEAERDAVQARAARAGQAVQRLERQAEQLRAYRDEYLERAPTRGGRSTGIDMLRTHRDFMQRLEQAVVQQRGQLEIAERDAAVLRAALIAEETRVAAIRKLIERRGQDAARHAARREQRRTDEDAQRAAGHARTLGGAW